MLIDKVAKHDRRKHYVQEEYDYPKCITGLGVNCVCGVV